MLIFLSMDLFCLLSLGISHIIKNDAYVFRRNKLLSLLKLRSKYKYELSVKEQALFFLPLALTSLIMVVSHTLFNAGLARMPRPEVMIAAFAVSKSTMHILQSPITMVRQTVTALITQRSNFRRTFIFLSVIVSVVVSVLAVTAFTGLSRIIFREIMGLSGRTLEEAIMMLRILFLFPLMVATRDFLFGLALKFRVTPLITIASAARIVYVLIFIYFLEEMSVIPGAYLAGLMFIGGIVIEVLVMFVGTKITVRNFSAALDNLENSKPTKPLTYGMLGRFYAPLILTSIIATSVMPLINSSLARTVDPDLALSAFAVAWGLGMIVLSPFMMFHQVTLNYIEPDNRYSRSVRRFAALVSLLSTILISLMAFTNLGYLILTRIIGTTHEISILANDVLRLMCLLPFLMVIREYYWGILMKRRQTKQIWQGKAINLLALVLVLALMVLAAPKNPAIIGAIGIICSEMAEISYHMVRSRKNRLKLQTGAANSKQPADRRSES